jgi:hypothetical protein
MRIYDHHQKMMGEEREVLQKELFRRNAIVFFWRSLGICLRVANDLVLMLWGRIDRVKLKLQLLRCIYHIVLSASRHYNCIAVPDIVLDSSITTLPSPASNLKNWSLSL